MNVMDQKFIMPLVAILMGAVLVYFDKLSGESWAYLTGGMVTAYLAVNGWTNQIDTKNAVTLAAMENFKQENNS